MFNAPAVVVTLCAVLIGLYVLQRLFLDDAGLGRLALTRDAVVQGHWETLLTSQFLHGSWPHVLLNSVGLFAFGPVTARLFGAAPRELAAFLAFYLTCGVLAGVGCIVFDLHPGDAVVGASGAISGLFGSASRILEGRGRIGSIRGPTVMGMAIAWTLANVLLGATGATPGAMGMPVAWQAHLAGYAAGVFLIGPFARLAGLDETAFTQ